MNNKRISLLVTAAFSCTLFTAAEAGLLYGTSRSGDRLISIDTDTLAVSDIGALGTDTNFGGLAYDAGSDTLFMIGGRGNNNLYTVDRGTGLATLVGSHGQSDLFGLAFDSSTGLLYGTGFSGSSVLVTLDTASAAATVINPGMGVGIGGLAYDSLLDRLIGIQDGVGNLFEIDRATGAQTLLFDGPNTNDSGLAYDADANLFWDLDLNGNLKRYDPTDGFAAQTVASSLPDVHGLAFVGTQPSGTVPAPATLGLAGLGLLLMGAQRRRAAPEVG